LVGEWWCREVDLDSAVGWGGKQCKNPPENAKTNSSEVKKDL